MDSNGPRPPTFVKGYPNASPQKYMNLGYLRSPYPGKTGWGDYGPSQGGEVYYGKGGSRYPGSPISGWHNPWNPVYYTPLDFSKVSSRVAELQTTYMDDVPLYLQPTSKFYGSTVR
jgi:hypothetical protein